MDNHQKFCENLGNTSFTRLNYDDTDREVREALKKGIEDYEQTADQRANDSKEMRGVMLTQQNSDLRKLGRMHRGCQQKRGGSRKR